MAIEARSKKEVISGAKARIFAKTLRARLEQSAENADNDMFLKGAASSRAVSTAISTAAFSR
jgi:hypothetical protein